MLCKVLGKENVIASDVMDQKFDFPCEFQKLDVFDEATYRKLVRNKNVNYICHLAGILSASGEKNPDLAIDVNVIGAINCLRIARDVNAKVFLPSSIAVFGGNHFPKVNTPIDVILNPTTVYGVSKVFNEMIGDYFDRKYNVDFRSIRYPGIISSEKYAFNGTTDYSTEIFFHALEKGEYRCPLGPKTPLPMMYIDDCIEATVKFMSCDPKRLTRTTYNLAGISFTPEQLAAEVEKLIPGFKMIYAPDFRQAIADSWPGSIDDKESKTDWGWSYDISVKDLAKKIFDGIEPTYKAHLKL